MKTGRISGPFLFRGSGARISPPEGQGANAPETGARAARRGERYPIRAPVRAGRKDEAKTEHLARQREVDKGQRALAHESGRFEFGHRQHQPLHAGSAEVDLHLGIRTAAFGRDDHAIAELGVAHELADAEATELARL